MADLGRSTPTCRRAPRSPAARRASRRSGRRTCSGCVVVAYLFFLVAWPVYARGAATRSRDGFEDMAAILDGPRHGRTRCALTVSIAVVAVVINTVFGVGISILLVRYEFPGKRLLSALLDLPLSVSPIVVGLALVLVYGGRDGWFGPTLEAPGFQVIFAMPGMIMATSSWRCRW